eukprot:3204951-Rhodomonas_salina.2
MPEVLCGAHEIPPGAEGVGLEVEGVVEDGADLRDALSAVGLERRAPPVAEHAPAIHASVGAERSAEAPDGRKAEHHLADLLDVELLAVLAGPGLRVDEAVEDAEHGVQARHLAHRHRI